MAVGRPHMVSQVGMGIPIDIGPHIPLTPSPNQFGRGLEVVLMHICTTASGLSTTPLSLRDFPGGNPGNTQSPPPPTLLCSGYPMPKNVVLPLLGCGTNSGCDPDGGDGLITCQSTIMALKNNPLRPGYMGKWGRMFL